MSVRPSKGRKHLFLPVPITVVWVSFANVSTGLWTTLALAMVAHYWPKKWYDVSVDLYVRAPFYAQAGALAALVIGLQYVAQTGAAPFVYQRF